MAFRSIAVAALCVGQAAAQSCPAGHSVSHGAEHTCLPDPCNVGRIKSPPNGNMGTCESREFEFVAVRHNPDATAMDINSMIGSLGTIGIPFDSWSESQALEFNDGAVFWSDPSAGPANAAQIAQITVPNGHIFRAVLSFQGHTLRNCHDVTSDSQDGCEGQNSWQEKNVEFSNQVRYNYQEYARVTPVVTHVATDGVAGFTTYHLKIYLKGDAQNVYAAYGDSEEPGHLPASYQEAAPFGADIGGTHAAFYEYQPGAQYDSFLTIGHMDMEHPDILDDVKMLVSGESCELGCNSGYSAVGEQPSCFAGEVTNSVQCVRRDGARLPTPTPSAASGKPARVQPTPPVRHVDPKPPAVVVTSEAPTTPDSEEVMQEVPDLKSEELSTEVPLLPTFVVVGAVSTIVVLGMLLFVATKSHWENDRIMAAVKFWRCRRATGVSPAAAAPTTQTFDKEQPRASQDEIAAGSGLFTTETAANNAAPNPLFSGFTIGE